MIALTFDDGPDPVWTPRVLDALAQADARATFFPLSPRAAAHPELIERVRAEGHAVGLHGWDHLRHPDSTREAVAADTDRALAVVDAHWWRLPWGFPAPWTAELAAERALRIAGFTHDTHDWRGDTAAAMLAALPPLHDDAIVLMHDAIGPGATRDRCAETVATIAPLVAQARQLGHEPVTLDALGAVTSARPG